MMTEFPDVTLVTDDGGGQESEQKGKQGGWIRYLKKVDKEASDKMDMRSWGSFEGSCRGGHVLTG